MEEAENANAAAVDGRWLMERLTGNNSPYAAIRREVDGLAAKRTITAADCDAAKADFQKHPSDPLLLFKWSYLMWKADASRGEVVGNHTREDYCRVPSPKAYDYTRLRFLMEVWHFRGQYFKSRQLLPLGERLLGKAPDDFPVRYQTLILYESSGEVGLIDKGIAIARAILVKEPKRNALRYLIGNCYVSRFNLTRSKKDARMCIEAMQDYVSHGGAGKGRKQAELTIGCMKDAAGQ